MAETGLGFHFFSSVLNLRCVFCFCFCFLSSVLCRDLAQKPKKVTLDVTSSLQKTLSVVSFDPFTVQRTVDNANVSFVFHLHNRDFLPKSVVRREDYKALTLGRLERDAARVKSLNAKLDLAVLGLSKSDLQPMKKTDGLEGPIISGTHQGSGEYFSRVGIGQPVKSFYMVLDTGSDLTWIQCQPCVDCYQQADPVFNPSLSSSFSPLPCESDQCRKLEVSTCGNRTCLYQVSYGDGSFTVGNFITESITFENSVAIDKIALGCGHDNEGLFVGAAGLLGLGGGDLSFPSQIHASSFSYCLVDRDSTESSTLEFGHETGVEAVIAEMKRNRKFNTFYYLGLQGISVGGDRLMIPSSSFEIDESGNGGIIVDSGTAITRLQTRVYNSLRDAFLRGTSDLPSAPSFSLFDTCYNLSSRTSVDVPTVEFDFTGGKSLKLPAKNYLIPVDSAGTFCFAFAPTASALSIVGNVQQQGTRVSFDLVNSLVGFESNKC